MSQENPHTDEKTNYSEELTLAGEKLLEKAKELLHEGNVRRIIVKQDERVIVEIPLTVGVVGTLVAPALAAIGAIGALMAHCTLEIVRADLP